MAAMLKQSTNGTCPKLVKLAGEENTGEATVLSEVASLPMLVTPSRMVTPVSRLQLSKRTIPGCSITCRLEW